MMNLIKIGERWVGKNQPCFIIAELSANHQHDFKRAKDLVAEAKECGVDAIKIQTYTPDTLTIDCDNEYFRIQHPVWGGQTLYELYGKAYTPWEWHADLKNYAEQLGLVFFSTAYDRSSADFLEKLQIPVYKIASFELVDIPLIKYVAKKKRPVMLSTGMANEEEVDLAVRTIRAEGNDEIILLKCTSSYPAKAEEMNLSSIPFLAEKFGTVAGLSDHSLTSEVAIAAVALGAKVIEKHFTLSRQEQGPDSHFSLEPQEMKSLVNAVRSIEKALGTTELGPTREEKNSMVFRKSLFAVRDIKKGESLTEENIRSIRPGYGLLPKYYFDLLGKTVTRDIKAGMPLSLDMIEGAK